jgi:hypothetical protein
MLKKIFYVNIFLHIIQSLFVYTNTHMCMHEFKRKKGPEEKVTRSTRTETVAMQQGLSRGLI